MGAFDKIALNTSYERWRWWVGIPRDFWVLNREVIGRVIQKNKLQPVEVEHLLGDDPVPIFPVAAADEASIARWVKLRPFPGGLRIPHLHFKGELFQLSDDQWAEFSGSVVSGFQERLSRAGKVDFNKLIELSDAIDSLG